MGRTNPTYRDKLREFESEMDQYRRALRHRDQRVFDDVFGHIYEHAMAGGAANLVEPRWTYWLAVAIEQERRIQALETEMAGFKEALELAEAAQSE